MKEKHIGLFVLLWCFPIILVLYNVCSVSLETSLTYSLPKHMPTQHMNIAFQTYN